MEDQVRVRQLLQGGLEGLHQMVGQFSDEAHRVGDQHRAGVGDLQGAGGGIQRIKQTVAGGDPRVGEGVEQGGLARVGVAHNGHHRHLVLLPPVPLDCPDPPDLLEVLGEFGNFSADVAAVGLQLGLTGAAGTDGGFAAGGRLTDQVPPHAGEAGQQVFVLGQFHLEAALLGAGPLGKDVQDEPCPVDDLDPHLLREHPLLGGGELVVENHQVSLLGLDQLGHLGHLSLPDEGTGLGRIPVLQEGTHTRSPGGLHQGGQLLQGGLAGIVLPGQAVGIEAHQHRPVSGCFFGMFGHEGPPLFLDRIRPGAGPG